MQTAPTTTFRNKFATNRGRPQDQSLVVACIAATNPDANRWEPADESIIDGLEQLYVQAGVRFYGVL